MVLWTGLLTGWLATNGAWAQEEHRPVTYAEALRGSVERNVALATALASRDQATGSLQSSQGQFDPSYQLDANWNQSRSQGFIQGFPFSSDSQRWSTTHSLQGSTGTGTTYALNYSLDRSIDDVTTSFGGIEQDNRQDAFTSNFDVSVTQELLRGILFRFNVQNVTSARTGLELAELEVEKQLQEALYQAAEAYWNWAYQQELHDIALASVEVAREALRVGKLQVESGQLAPVEATRLEAALVQAQQSAIDAGNLAEQAANVTLLAMSEDPGQPVLPATRPGDVPDATDLDLEKAVDVALAQNLDLQVARRNVDQAQVDLSNAKHGLLPSLSATAGGGVASQRCPPGSDIQGCEEGGALASLSGLTQDDNQPSVRVSGRFVVPLGNRAARGDVHRIRATYEQRKLDLQAQERQVAAQVEEQVRALQSARVRTELADANARLAEETLDAEEALAAAGRTLQKDVLEARTEVDRTRAEAAKARTDYRLAQAMLLKLQGQLTEQIP